jgi:hypothetical protein
VFENTGLEIHSYRYTKEGTSNAKKLRAFWKLESNHMVGKLLLALVDYVGPLEKESRENALADQCRQIATCLLSSGHSLTPLKEREKVLNAKEDC